jgi:hypothetical protein
MDECCHKRTQLVPPFLPFCLLPCRDSVSLLCRPQQAGTILESETKSVGILTLDIQPSPQNCQEQVPVLYKLCSLRCSVTAAHQGQRRQHLKQWRSPKPRKVWGTILVKRSLGRLDDWMWRGVLGGILTQKRTSGPKSKSLSKTTDSAHNSVVGWLVYDMDIRC